MKLHLFALLSCLLLTNSLRAQHYNFINYSTESGLAQSQIRSIAQDKNGYLWLATLAGLSRYDGKKFINYSIQNGLIDNQIFSLLADKSIGLWIGTVGGLNYFDGSKFKSYLFKEEMSENIINAIGQDAAGNLWLATDGSGICKFNGKNFEYFTEENGIVNNNVRAVCVDDKGLVWFGTKNGICYYDGSSFKHLDTALAQPQNVSHIFMDRHKKLWFSTFGEGVYCYDGKTFKNYRQSDGLNDWIRSAIEDSDGNIWFASKFGLYKFDGKICTRYTEAAGLPMDNTNVVFEDKERNIWIGSDGKGLCKFLGETFTYLTTKDGLISNLVLSILEDKDQNLWFSTFKGLTKKQGSQMINYTIDEDGLNSNTVWASLKDRDNNLWFCTAEGVSRFDGKRFTSYGMDAGLGARTVYAVCQDHKGNLWFGTTQGVSMFDGQHFTNYSSGTDDNMGKDVTSIVEDKNNCLWFASKNGLYKFENNRFTKYTTANGLCNNNLSSLVVDDENNLWIGSKAGINCYDGKTFLCILIDGAFNSNNVYFLALDKKESLWIGTNTGVFALDTREYLRSRQTRFRHYTIYDGLPGMECNQNAAFRDHRGNIWMGTTEGVIKYDPNIRDFHSSNFAPITHISGVRLFLKDTNWTRITKHINPATLLPENLKVNYQTSHFTFDYIGIKLSNPSSVRYKYMLEGFDESWSTATDATFATYSNLPNGKYTFKVIAGDLMGNWNKEPASFSFEILPPFWTRWWFILLCVLAGLFILWGLYRSRVNDIRKKHQTQQLEYKSKLMLLEHQSLNSSMNRHFIFNALNSIQYYMNKEDKLSAHKYLSRFAKLIRMNLDSSMSNLVPVSEEIERLDLYLQLELMRFEDKFEYSITIAKDIDTESIEIPPMLLQPYVENSILHGILPSGRAGRIDIRVEHNSDQHIVFSIQDNGIGIEESKARKLSTKNPHVSRGTSITTQRIQLLGKMNNIGISINGPFEVRGPQNEVLGTRVELIIN